MLKNRISILFIISLVSFSIIFCSCKIHKDCKGRKKVTKTDMGGWL